MQWYRQKTAKRYILSYLLIGLLPILVLGFIFCFRQLQAGKEAVERMAYEHTREISQYFENDMQAVETAALHLSTNYIEHGNRAQDEDFIPRQLATYEEAYALQGELLFYPRGQADLYTSEQKMSYIDFQRMKPYGMELDRISFYTRINTVTSNLYISSMGYQNESNYFVSFNPIPYLDANPSGTMVYLVGLDTFRSAVTNYLGDFDGYFCVLDADHRVSYLLDTHLSHSQDTIRNMLTALKGTPMVETHISNESFVTFRYISDARGFTYLLSIPRKIFYRDVYRNVAIYAASFSALALFAILASFFIARKQFMPLRALEEFLTTNDEISESIQRDDIFAAIQRRYTSMQTQNEQLLMQLQSHAALARSRLFNDLLAGRLMTAEALKEAMQLSGTYFDYSGFFVLIAQLFEAQGRSGLASDASPYFSEVLFRYGKAYAVETGDSNRLAFIVNVDRSRDEDFLICQYTADLFQNKLRELGFSCSGMGCSRIHSTPQRLNQSLFEALAAIDHNPEGIQFFAGQKEDERDLPYSFADCELLRQGMLYGNSDMTLSILEKMVQKVQQQNLPVTLQQSFRFMLVNLLLSLRGKVSVEIDQVELSIAASIAAFDDFIPQIEHYIRLICQQVQAEKQKKQDHFYREVIEYIYQHFTEHSLTVETVSDAFHISGSYVRKIVKEITGDSFTNYLTTLRFSYIKQQLAETQIAIKDVIEAAGYVDVSSFTRKFKTQEGITPGQYREFSQSIQQK